MSFIRRKKNVDYKARLEHKLYLARENPEPIFDLSDCALKTVPSGIFALCKVFRKEKLCLQENQLTSLAGGGRIEDLYLIQVLDLHSNSLQKLPHEIASLKNLRELNVSANKLSNLPENLGEITNLHILDVSDNNLKCLPHSLGNLHFLKRLDVQINKKLTKLPLSLCHAVCLEEILLDHSNFEYPPQDIVQQGTSAIMQFLCVEEGVDYISPENALSSIVSKEKEGQSKSEEREDDFQAKILQLETLKEQKQQERLALEQEIFEQKRRELELQNAMKSNKEKLLEDLAQQQSQLESEILKVQQEHESERLRLLNEVQRVEAAASNLISQLLASSYLKDSRQIQALVEQESKEEQRLLNSCHEEYQSLIHKDILNAMKDLLEEEAQHEAKVREHERGKAESTRSILNQELENNEALNKLLLKHEQDRECLITQLQRDEELQRTAVATLMERGDARSWSLTQHLRLIQEQLAAVTAIEMKRRKLQISEQVEDLSSKRAALSELLMELLSQQAARRKQLLEMLNELERRRCEEEERRSQDFWLIQYQRLLDLRSTNLTELERTLDPLLAHYLLQEGVVHCLPLLTNWVLNPSTLVQLSHEKLCQVGISSSQTRDSVLRAVNLYLEDQRQRDMKLAEQGSTSKQPSAPAESDVETVSNIGFAECVVCMDKECGVIFIPCGHLCTCIKCSDSLIDCPLCRATIEQKIRVILP